MAKKKDKAAAPVAPTDANPTKRSKAKLALLVLVPLLVLGGGGYAGWTFFLTPEPEAAHAAPGEHGAEGERMTEGHGVDPREVAALEAAAAAETSFTYSFALSELLKTRCGAVAVDALKAASDAEAEANGMLVQMSWQAALRRTGTLTEASCDLIVSEIRLADAKAASAAEAKASTEKGGNAEALRH